MISLNWVMYVILAFALLFLAAILGSEVTRGKYPSLSAAFGILAVASAITFGGSLFLSFLWFSFTHHNVKPFRPGMVVVEKQTGEVLRQFDSLTMQVNPFWDKDRFAVIEPFQPTEITMAVDPITDNPKVRHIKYSVEYMVENDPQAWVSFIQEFGDESAFKTVIESHLYDFNEEYSRQLAEFYNPLNSSQQAEFGELVGRYLQPHLERGQASIVEARFWLPKD